MQSKNWNEFEKQLKILCFSWHNHRLLSLRKIQNLLKERGVSIHYSTISRWLKKQDGKLVAQPIFDENKKVEAAKIMVKGQAHYLYTLLCQDQLLDFKLLRKTQDISSVSFEFHQALQPNQSFSMPISENLTQATGALYKI